MLPEMSGSEGEGLLSQADFLRGSSLGRPFAGPDEVNFARPHIGGVHQST